MVRRILIVLLILIILIAGVAFFTSGTSTPAFVDANGQVLPGSIAEERRVTLGGVEQYILLRGRDRTAPLLVYVHGGPGMTSTPFLRKFNADLENDFLAVYWDQRGTLNSFDAELDPAEFTIAQLTADLGELIDLLLAEFEQEKVLLVGHSWGTILGLEHVAARPETVAAYIGVAQTTSQQESDAEGFEWALAEAQATGNERVVSELEALGPPPYTIDEFVTQRQNVNLLGGGSIEGLSDLDYLRIALSTSEFAWPNVPTVVQGVRFSSEALWEEQREYDARTRHTSVEAPIVLMLGRYDRIISPRLGAEFLDALEAPYKELIWFENSAHSPLYEEPERFNEAVRQVAQDVGLLPE